MQLAEGVDDGTWTHHLRLHEYSRWFRNAIGDRDLGAAAEGIEQDESLSSREGRRRIVKAIEKRYTREP